MADRNDRPCLLVARHFLPVTERNKNARGRRESRSRRVGHGVRTHSLTSLCYTGFSILAYFRFTTDSLANRDTDPTTRRLANVVSAAGSFPIHQRIENPLSFRGLPRKSAEVHAAAAALIVSAGISKVTTRSFFAAVVLPVPQTRSLIARLRVRTRGETRGEERENCDLQISISVLTKLY